MRESGCCFVMFTPWGIIAHLASTLVRMSEHISLGILVLCILRLNHTLARMTLWPETLWPGHFGQNDTLARVTLWPVTLWPETLWPERHFGQ